VAHPGPLLNPGGRRPQEFADWQWDSFLALNTPDQYKAEMAAAERGGRAANATGVSRSMARVQVLANLPGDLKDIKFVLRDELAAGRVTAAFAARVSWLLAAAPGLGGHSCSMLAVWGSRTAGGALLSARNLDWNTDTGAPPCDLNPGPEKLPNTGTAGLIQRACRPQASTSRSS
jgi:hypothetical protein